MCSIIILQLTLTYEYETEICIRLDMIGCLNIEHETQKFFLCGIIFDDQIIFLVLFERNILFYNLRVCCVMLLNSQSFAHIMVLSNYVKD